MLNFHVAKDHMTNPTTVDASYASFDWFQEEYHDEHTNNNETELKSIGSLLYTVVVNRQWISGKQPSYLHKVLVLDFDITT
jgi:hypothetical protein